MSSRTAPKRYGRTTHQLVDAPYGGFGPDMLLSSTVAQVIEVDVDD